jgi:hypothetical protein
MSTPPTLPSIQCANADLHPGMQGIGAVAIDDVRAQLLVTFLRPFALSPPSYLLDPASYSLLGGQRLFPRVTRAELPPPASPPNAPASQVLLTLDGLGDFSVYTLTVIGPDIDPFFASRKLRFRLACDERFDCRLPPPSPATLPERPVVIDYLAKDFSSFRQALLDFIPILLPGWTERSEADLGMMLLELLAYTADNLSYMQDRVGNEAFLATATQRRSVAGHLQLIGYQMDEGTSASTWLQFNVNGVHTLTRDLRISNQPKTAAEPLIIFEPLAETRLDARHNTIALYTWGNDKCCLPPTALSMALNGPYPDLAPGDYLLIQDKQHRDVVRLTSRPEIMTAPFPSSTPSSPPVDAITIVRWSQATPLNNEYCASEVTVSGNMVVATHGQTVSESFAVPPAGPQRLRVKLSMAPIAHLDAQTMALVAPVASPASSTTNGFTQAAARSISSLTLKVGDETWQQQPSLLDSTPDAKVYRVEISDSGEATVVFGQGGTGAADQQFGLRPPSSTDDDTQSIEASYRVGGGTVGNVAAGTLVQADPSQVVVGRDWLNSVINPLPATGGRDLESRDHARRIAPGAFKEPLVAVTAADYQAAAQGFTRPDGSQPIQRGNVAFRWTGSWLTAELGIEVRGAEGLDSALASDLLRYLDGRRLAGYDVQVAGAAYVSIDLMVDFCVASGFRSADVQQRIQRVLSNSAGSGGVMGLFMPGNFSFGDPLYASQVYAAVMRVAGVESARIVRLARLRGERPDDETRANLSRGYLAVGRDQIVRLDNDRDFPENGVATVRPLERVR